MAQSYKKPDVEEVETIENELIPKKISDGEHYEVWVTLERWAGYDEKAEDCQTTKIADIAKREDAEVIFEVCEAAAVGIAPVIINNFGLKAET